MMAAGYHFTCILHFLVSTFVIYFTNALECVDHNQNAVDWFAAYKLPKIKHQNNLLDEGVAYTFVTSNNSRNWALSNISINDTNSIIGLTLQKLYEGKDDQLYILYNDEVPTEESSSTKGHTKGVVLGDENGGIWLIHSVPKFPLLENKYSYPETGTDYGQSFLCISLNVKNLDIVGKQLQYNEPQIYKANIPRKLQKKVPNLADAAHNKTIRSAPWYSVANLTSKGGVSFISFAKGRRFSKDLYSDLVAPSLRSNLDVETWPNGRNRLNSSCSNPFKVLNVESLIMKVANVTFKSTKDHSKWAISETSTSSWICIGDINRMKSQRKRGGGTVCFDNENVSSLYRKCIEELQKC